MLEAIKVRKGLFGGIILVVLLIGLSVVTLGKPIKIIHVALGNYGAHWVQVVAGEKLMAKELGIDLTVLSGQMSSSRQVQMLEAAIREKPDGIFIDHGEGSSLTPGIERAIKEGIPVVIFDVITPAKVVLDISQDDYMLAYKSLSKLAFDLKGKGNIIVITLSGVAPLERRMKILPLILQRFEGLKVVKTLSPSFTSAVITDTMTLVQAALRSNKNVDAIWAPYDALAIGALKAEELLGKHIPIYSVDVSPQDLSLMAAPNSPWKATAACNPAIIGKVAMRALYLAATGHENEIKNPYAIIPAVLITQKVARSLDLTHGEYLSEKTLKGWDEGDSEFVWTPELKKIVENYKKSHEK